MNDRLFKFTVPDEIIRTMNREQYYKAMSWLRECGRAVQQEMEIFEKKADVVGKYFRASE